MEKKTKINKQFDKQFGAFVKRLRVERGWSQADLAAKMGNNFQNISRLERGETSPTLYWCYKLSDVFDMEMLDVIKEFGFSFRK